MFAHYINTKLVCFERILKIAQHLAKLQGKVDCHKRPTRSGTVLLKDELA